MVEVIGVMEPEEQSMEQVLAHLVRLRAAIQQDLAHRFGPRPWQPAPSVAPFQRSAADDGSSPGTAPLSLGTVSFPGTSRAVLWRAAAATVAGTGNRFGFTGLVIHEDSPEGLAFTGRHPAGHTYRFGIGATTVLAVRSGPAAWSGPPYRSANDLPVPAA